MEHVYSTSVSVNVSNTSPNILAMSTENNLLKYFQIFPFSCEVPLIKIQKELDAIYQENGANALEQTNPSI